MIAVGRWIAAVAIIAGLVAHRSRIQPASGTDSVEADCVVGNSGGDLVTTRPIEQIRVGDRVLADNPETSGASPAASEPNWTEWLHLKACLGSGDQQLHVELLRPEDWIRQRLYWVSDSQHTAIAMRELRGPGVSGGSSGKHPPLLPLHGLYFDILRGWSDCLMAANDVRLSVVIDLPELGAYGLAQVQDIQACTHLDNGIGQVVTGTFHHLGSQLLDVAFAASDVTANQTTRTERLTVTSGHLFWSEDRQRFVPIEQMQAGERLRKQDATICYLESTRPHAGAEDVFNLEVFGEHVYYVGNWGVLAHNMCAEPGLSDHKVTNSHYGREAELNAIRTLERAGFEHIPGAKLRGDTGFDGIFLKRNADGSVQRIVLTESKMTFTGDPRFSTLTDGTVQMSNDWVDNVIARMLSRSSNPNDEFTRFIGSLLLSNRNLITRKVNVTDRFGRNRWNVLGLPD